MSDQPPPEHPGSTPTRTSASTPPVSPPQRVCLLARFTALPDAELGLELESKLRACGYTVFLDRHRASGLAWAQAFEQQVRQADLVIPLLSEASAQSELLAYEVEMAADAAQQQGGWPRLMPVRVAHKGPLPEQLAGILQPIEFEWDDENERYRSHLVRWNSPADNQALVGRICQRLTELALEKREPPGAKRSRKACPAYPLEPLGGAVPLDSAFYVVRPTDEGFATALQRSDSLVLVKGARQMGKTSLLARGIQQAREAGRRVAITDFQKLQVAHFTSIQSFYAALSELIAGQLAVAAPPPKAWERSPNATFEDFWRREVLAKLQRPVVWACDEFDRLLTTRFGSEVCGLLRSWHNARVLEPDGPWGLLTIAIAYATEAHLFISDLNQSPFNVGTRLTLEDFSPAEVAELNHRYGSPLAEDKDLPRFYELLGGQPYLVRCALQEMVAQNAGFELLEQQAELEEGIFGDHLQRVLVSLGTDPGLLEVVSGLLLRGTPPPLNLFYRLRSAGVIRGTSPSDARLRCALYDRYLRRHLRDPQ